MVRAGRTIRRIGGSLCLLVCAAACGAQPLEVDTHPQERVPIAPQQFAFVPCDPGESEDAPACALLAAGGKYYLLGAPEGATASLLASEIRLLDGVLLFSLLPGQIDGVDTVRHETWAAGRAQPLMLAGPEGTEAFAKAIDSAFEVSDAEYFARESPAGGFDASLLHGVEISFDADSGTEVVDTGDLQIRGFYAPSGQIVYQATYGGQVATAGLCVEDIDSEFFNELGSDRVVQLCASNKEIEFIVK